MGKNTTTKLTPLKTLLSDPEIYRYWHLRSIASQTNTSILGILEKLRSIERKNIMHADDPAPPASEYHAIEQEDHAINEIMESYNWVDRYMRGDNDDNIDMIEHFVRIAKYQIPTYVLNKLNMPDLYARAHLSDPKQIPVLTLPYAGDETSLLVHFRAEMYYTKRNGHIQSNYMYRFQSITWMR